MDTRFSGFRQSNRNGLFGRTSPVFALSNIMDLLTDEFSRLCRGCLTFSFLSHSTLPRFLFRHVSVLLFSALVMGICPFLICHPDKSDQPFMRPLYRIEGRLW